MPTKKLIKEIIIDRNPDAIFLDKEFDEALIGSAIPLGQKHVAIYNSDECIKIIIKKMNLNEIEAYEQFSLIAEMSKYSPNKPILFSNFKNIKEPILQEIKEDVTLDDLL